MLFFFIDINQIMIISTLPLKISFGGGTDFN